MNQNDSYKDNESMETFVQNDVFKELELAEKAVTDIYKFKEDFRVKTVYESFSGLYKFGDKFKFILSFLTASLATIGLFFLFYFDTFEGYINYVLIALAVIFGLSVAIGLEFTKYVISPIAAKSWLRDGKIQKSLIITLVVIMCASVGSTVYGTYKIIELYYVPVLVDVEAVGGDKKTEIANYQTKIDKAENEKTGIETRRKNYEKKSGKNGSWIQDKVYNQLVADISNFEAQIITLRGQIRTDKQTTKTDNQDTEIKHASNKYAFVWVGGIVALLCELGLAIVLFLLQKYKFSTLKQLDTIQSPLQTVLNLVQNPLTTLKSHLVGGNGLVIASSGGGHIPQNVTNQGLNVPPIATNQAANVSPLNITTSNVPPLVTNSTQNISSNAPPIIANNQPQNYSNSLYTGGQNRRAAGFRIGENNTANSSLQNTGKRVSVQSVSTNDLAKIELKILHYKKQVRDTQNRLNKLKQKSAIIEAKKVLKNRQQNLKNWQKKKADFQGKTIS